MLAICQASGGLTMSASADPASGPGLLPGLPGPRTLDGTLILDETHGRFGPLRLGMTMEAAEKAMPQANYWITLHQGQDLEYCSQPETNSCGGSIRLRIYSACAYLDAPQSCLAPGAIGLVVDIALEANTNPRPGSEDQGAVTLRGIGLGSPQASILHNYIVTQRAPYECIAQETPMTATYVAVAGKNTIVPADPVWGQIKTFAQPTVLSSQPPWGPSQLTTMGPSPTTVRMISWG
jgi:hypothetical protein